MRHALLAIPFLVLAGCGTCGGRSAVRVMTPTGDAAVTWTDEELKREIAAKPIRADERVSASVVRVAGAEKPHTHDQHDLVVTLLRGRARMHLGSRVEEVSAGDVVEIPRGVVHWAESLDGPCEAYVVSTPPYDPKDTHPVSAPTK